jgi:hypothetical protein
VAGPSGTARVRETRTIPCARRTTGTPSQVRASFGTATAPRCQSVCYLVGRMSSAYWSWPQSGSVRRNWFSMWCRMACAGSVLIIASQWRSSRGCGPVTLALEQRRRLVEVDGLARSVDRRPPEMSEGLQFGGHSMQLNALEYIAEIVQDAGVTRVLEFGSGTSTCFLGGVLSDRGGQLLSIEQDHHWAGQCLGALHTRGIRGVSVVVAPLIRQEASGTSVMGYEIEDELGRSIRELHPELVLIDGPSKGSGASRLATAPGLVGWVDPRTRFVLHDALRDAELMIAQRWESHPGLDVSGILPIGNGLLIGSFR